MKPSRKRKAPASDSRSSPSRVPDSSEARIQRSATPVRHLGLNSPRSAVAKNIQMARTVFNWSQESLGSRCDLNRTHISALERESLSVGIDTLDRIADAFGVAAYVLLMPPPEAQRLLYQSFMDSTANSERKTPNGFGR